MAKTRNDPTMKDVARLADVSLQTVSAVINGKKEITEPTRNRVLKAVKELGYRPYAVARSLRTRQTRTIAFVVSDIANPSIAMMANVAEDCAYRAGYNLALYNTHDDVEREASTILAAIQRWHDGILFVSVRDFMDSLAALRDAGIPAVAIDRIPEDYTGPSITIDNVRAGQMVAEHLTGLGHTRFAHISGPRWLRLARERMAGFLGALAERGLAPESVATDEGNWTCQAGYEAMQRILQTQPRPTALFAANDRMALGAMQAAHEAGLRVPEDLSVVGLDDVEAAASQIPPLTTVRQPFEAMSTWGVQQLLERIGGAQPEPSQVVLQPEFILRKSTAPAPSRLGA